MINNKFYIGITSETLEHRWNGHIRKAKFGSTTNFHQAIMKYGKENFKNEILEKFETNDKKYAYSIEQKYINQYNAVKDGYNMDIGFGWNIADRKGSKNPMYGKISGNAKMVNIDGITYQSLYIASKTIGINLKTLSAWVRDGREKYKNYYYIV